MGVVETIGIPPLGYELDGKVKVFRLIAQPIEQWITDGKSTQDKLIPAMENILGAHHMNVRQKLRAWGYNGITPGPTIEITEGDTIRVIFKNELPVTFKHEAARAERIAKELTNEDVTFHDIPENFDDLILKGLSKDDALRIALLNNKALLAAFQELGIAKADLVEAGLYKKPSVAVSFNIPDHHDRSITTNIELEAPNPFIN